jgi:hypothetical protein
MRVVPLAETGKQKRERAREKCVGTFGRKEKDRRGKRDTFCTKKRKEDK